MSSGNGSVSSFRSLWMVRGRLLCKRRDRLTATPLETGLCRRLSLMTSWRPYGVLLFPTVQLFHRAPFHLTDLASSALPPPNSPFRCSGYPRNVSTRPSLVGLLLALCPAFTFGFTTFAPFTAAFQLARSRWGVFRHTHASWQKVVPCGMQEISFDTRFGIKQVPFLRIVTFLS